MSDLFWLLAIFVVGVGALVGAVFYGDSRTCHTRAGMMRLESSWGPWQGCMVNTGDRWAPIEYIRIINGEVSIQGARRMTAHTPGPWTFQPNSDELIAPQVVVMDDDGACGDPECCGSPTYYWGCHIADGRLIAAAPDLLAALNDLLAAPTSTLAMQRAFAAIAKATQP